MKRELRLIGKISVDSGTIWLGDPCYVLHGKKPNSIGENWSDLCDIIYEDNQSQLPKSFNHDMGFEGLGVMCHTKWGDGLYQVYMVGENDGIFISFE